MASMGARQLRLVSRRPAIPIYPTVTRARARRFYSREVQPQLEPKRSIVEDVRLAMRAYPQPLAVVAAFPSSSEHPAHGMLVSSFTTVALEPKPYVSFTIKLPSRTYNAIEAAHGVFKVSAITDAEVAQWWINHSPAYSHDTQGSREAMNRSLDRPLENGRKWAMTCKWLADKTISVGDHVIVVAEVIDVERPSAQVAKDPSEDPILLWVDRSIKRPS